MTWASSGCAPKRRSASHAPCDYSRDFLVSYVDELPSRMFVNGSQAPFQSQP